MNNVYGYIYKTTNLVNGRFYLGQKRGLFNPKYLGSGKAIKHAINKYGRDKFKVEIIIEVSSQEILDYLEKMVIMGHRKSFGPRNLYNIADGGGGAGNYGQKSSEETRQKLRLSHLGKPSGRKGKHLSQETKERLRQANLGKIYSPETNKKKGRKGRIFSAVTREKIRQALIGNQNGKKLT